MDLATSFDRLRDLVGRVAAIGDHPDDDVDLRLRKHALAVTAVGLIPASLLWTVIGIAIGQPLLTASSISYVAALLVGLAVMARTKAFGAVVRALLIAGMGYVFVGHIALGGLVSGGASLAWGILAPISAVLFFDGRRSVRWFGGYAAMVVAAIVLDTTVTSLVPRPWEIAPVWLFAYNLLGPALVVLLLVRFVDGQRLDAQRTARSLLLDMLPAAIAERLARGERLIAEVHPSASVVFADVVNFTGLAATIDPRELLLTLNQLFSVFDRLAARHGLDKIKTMGDSYVAVAGAPLAREDHATAAVEMAVEMHRAVARLRGLRKRGIRLRVGVASGPITAGVIGENKWAYDVWGDTVNLAARMESYGVPGMVQVAPSTRELLGEAFPLKMRTVDVKGKGVMATYLVDPGQAPAYHRVTLDDAPKTDAASTRGTEVVPAGVALDPAPSVAAPA